MLRRVLAAILLTLVLAAPAGASTPLARKLAKALAVPHVSGSRSAAIALDLLTGQLVFGRNPALPLVPASNEKLAVTYAALVVLGPAYRIATDVVGEGGREGGVWRGDLVLVGHGDPTLSTPGLRRLAARIRALGIRRVTGRVVGDESYFDARRRGPGWASWFYLNESPPLSALVVDRTRYRGKYSRNPALAAASIFRRELAAVGISVAVRSATGKADDSAFPLGSVLSPPLEDILRFMDSRSDNFTAELLLKQLGAYYGDEGTSAAGAAVIRQTLADADVPVAGVRIVDGSGLSPRDRLTTNALVAMLRSLWSDVELRPALLSALPVAGKTGTLEDRLRQAPAFGHVVAKTGTTFRASALSGFVRNRFAFAILQNGNPISSWWARLSQDRFASVLAAQ